MSVLQLERATLGPKCWENFVLKFGTADENPTHWPILETPNDLFLESPDPADPFHFLYLTPGGRFLATLSWGSYLGIWDLGLGPVARHEALQSPVSLQHIDCDFYWVHPAVDGSAIRILAKKLEDNTHTCKLYDFTLHTAEPQLKEMASLQFQDENETDYIAVCEDKVILVNALVIRVWNFVRNEWAAWDTSERSSQMFVKHNTVIQISPSGIVVWPIPTLRPVREILPAPDAFVPEHSPAARLDYPEGTVNASFWCQAICEWYTGSDQPIYFEITHNEAEETCDRFQRFEVVIPKESENQAFIRPVLDYEIRFEPDTDAARNAYSQYRVCEGKIAMWWASPTRIYSTFGPQTASSDFQARKIVLGKINHAGWETVSFDPISGRLAYITGEDETRVKVCDFLPDGYALPVDTRTPEGDGTQIGDDGNTHTPPESIEGLSIGLLQLDLNP